MSRCRQDRGIALVVVLWVSLLVAAIAGAFVVDTRTSARLARNFVDDATARALADGGVQLAVFELLQRDEDARPRRDGRVYRRTVPGGALEFAVEDEAGKIDLNLADRVLLTGLIRSAGVPTVTAQGLTEMIEGMRTGDSTSERGLRALGLPTDRVRRITEAIAANRPATEGRRPYRPRGDMLDRPFIAVDAFGQLPGVDTALYAFLRPALTVYGERGGLNLMNAPREALLAIPDVTAEAVDIFLVERQTADTPAPLQRFLAQGQARNYHRDSQPGFVTVKVLAHAEGGAVFARIAVVEIIGRPDRLYEVREWREGDAAMFAPRPTESEGVAGRGGST